MNKTCATCHFYIINQDQPHQGFCVSSPPTVVLVPVSVGKIQREMPQATLVPTYFDPQVKPSRTNCTRWEAETNEQAN